jgi:nitrogen fixation/metabolism regulation signal transduction histidine kinase
MKWNNIGFKLKFTFVVIFVLLFLTLVLSVFSLNKSIKSVEKVILKNQMLQFNLLDLNQKLLEEINLVKDIIVLGDNDIFYKKKFQKYKKYSSLIDRKINEIIQNYNAIQDMANQDLKKEITSLPNYKKNIDEILEKVISIYRIKGKKEAINYLFTHPITKYYIKVSHIAPLNRRIYDKIFEDAINKKQNTIYAIAVFFVIVILVAVFLTNYTVKKFTENTKYLINSAEHMSLGNLDEAIETQSNDELEDIAKVFEYLRLELRKITEKIKEKKKY